MYWQTQKVVHLKPRWQSSPSAAQITSSENHVHGSSVDRNLVCSLFTCKPSFGLPCLDFSLTGLSETDFCPHIQWNEGPGEIVYMACMQPPAFAIDCANVAGLEITA
ncbi:hypothetical protein Pint_25849 [Pistacia integerrima]|uniref:Uncharacterized protein n=1 Tax=Pistacia integerrima TaxID=434235 RepID=A0ACC0YFI6_9ROSI|nr:hypothetical protein Pint_25849 [Pistacia integerrima]